QTPGPATPSARQPCAALSWLTRPLVMSPNRPVRYFGFIGNAVCNALTATPWSPLSSQVQVNLAIPDRTGPRTTCPTRMVSLVSRLADLMAPTDERQVAAIRLSESPLRTL